MITMLTLHRYTMYRRLIYQVKHSRYKVNKSVGTVQRYTIDFYHVKLMDCCILKITWEIDKCTFQEHIASTPGLL